MMTTTFAYRDDAEGAAIRHADLLTRRTRDDRALADARRVYGRRLARMVAGTTGIAATVVLASAAAAIHLANVSAADGTLTKILLGAWPVMGLAYIAGRVDLWRRATEPFVAGPRGRDLHAEIARLEQELPIAESRTRAHGLEGASVTLPLVAVALLAPLTLHALANALMGDKPLGRFDTWIVLSLVIVGHAHLVLAWMVHRFSAHVRTSTSGELLQMWRVHAWRALGFTILASAIPGALLILLPPILTAITGFVVVPLAFRTAAHAVVTERALLDVEA